MTNRRKLPLVGEVRWVSWDFFGRETDYVAEQPRTLTVTVTDTEPGVVTEMTLTENVKTRIGLTDDWRWVPHLPPEARKAGWVKVGVSDGKPGPTTWVRTRRVRR